jgi:hypothetical protein
MRILTEKETDLIALAVFEGTLTTERNLNMDFGIERSLFTVHQQYRLQQIESLLYTLFCEVVEENGVLQSEYDQKTII